MSSTPYIERIVSRTPGDFDDWVLITPADPGERDGVLIWAVDQDMVIWPKNVGEDALTGGYIGSDPPGGSCMIPAGKTYYFGFGKDIEVYGAAHTTAGKCVVTEVV